jgi:hypothetical protein
MVEEFFLLSHDGTLPVRFVLVHAEILFMKNALT